MLRWLSENREWIFSGAGIAIIVAIFGFLRSLRKKPAAAIVVVRVEHDSSSPDAQQGAETTTPQRHATLVPIERIAPITAVDIQKALRQSPPLQRQGVAKRFIGLKIEWDTSLGLATEQEGQARLSLRADPEESLFSVKCTVSLSDYKELGILPEGSKIRVYGEIVGVDLFDVELQNARLLYLEAREGL